MKDTTEDNVQDPNKQRENSHDADINPSFNNVLQEDETTEDELEVWHDYIVVRNYWDHVTDHRTELVLCQLAGREGAEQRTSSGADCRQSGRKKTIIMLVTHCETMKDIQWLIRGKMMYRDGEGDMVKDFSVDDGHTFFEIYKL